MAEWDREGAIWTPYAPEPPEQPVEARFAELFKAARVLLSLLKEGIVEEDLIYPTLALAGAGGHDPDLATLKDRIVSGWGNRGAREALARDLAQRCNGGLWPVRVKDGALVVKQVPAAAGIEPYRGTKIPEQVKLVVFPHRAPKDCPSKDHAADCAAARYEETLSAAGVPHEGVSGEGPTDGYFEGGVMHVTVRHCEGAIPVEHVPIVFRDRKPLFRSPVLVREHCLTYLKGPTGSGFLRFLKPREHGRDHEPGNLIPACVAALLRADGKLKWAPVRRLLNQQKIYERNPFPEDELDKGYESRKRTLERSARNARQRLLVTAGIIQSPL